MPVHNLTSPLRDSPVAAAEHIEIDPLTALPSMPLQIETEPPWEFWSVPKLSPPVTATLPPVPPRPPANDMPPPAEPAESAALPAMSETLPPPALPAPTVMLMDPLCPADEAPLWISIEPLGPAADAPDASDTAPLDPDAPLEAEAMDTLPLEVMEPPLPICTAPPASSLALLPAHIVS